MISSSTAPTAPALPSTRASLAPTPDSWDLARQRDDYAARRFLAMPLAGTLAWLVVAAVGAWAASPTAHVWTVYIATGMIAYLGIGLSKLTGEDFLDRSRPRNAFDALFFFAVGQALLAYAIVIPAMAYDYTFLPLGVGILSGMMWVVFGWIVRHWIGPAHALVRTAACLALHYAFPDHRFVAVPLGIVACYLVVIVVLERRWRGLRGASERH